METISTFFMSASQAGGEGGEEQEREQRAHEELAHGAT